MKWLPKWLLVIVGVMLVLRLFVGQSFIVTGESMAPELLRGDVVLVSTFGRYEAEVDEVVVLRAKDRPTTFVKRITGLAGPFGYEGESYDVPEGHVFVLGDNRENSLDSRHPTRMGGTGFVAETDVIGEVKMVLLSVTDEVSLFRPWTWYRLRHDRWFKVVE